MELPVVELHRWLSFETSVLGLSYILFRSRHFKQCVTSTRNTFPWSDSFPVSKLIRNRLIALAETLAQWWELLTSQPSSGVSKVAWPKPGGRSVGAVEVLSLSVAKIQVEIAWNFFLTHLPGSFACLPAPPPTHPNTQHGTCLCS